MTQDKIQDKTQNTVQGRMQDLGRLEDLPEAYRTALREHNLAPLWPSLRSLIPPHQPKPQTQATLWSYAQIKPLLLQAGELTPIEKAERRVLVLANPGQGLDKMQASPAIYLGMQLLLPGEWAPAHRHTPNAVRMVVEGAGAYTTVEGVKCSMERGDLILTPTGLWHEHGHDGTEPVIWLDVLDLPLVHYLEASYHENGSRQTVKQTDAEIAHIPSGLLVTPLFVEPHSAYPMLRYPWQQTKSALQQLAATQADLKAVQVSYRNPETGAACENILGFSALMLRAGETLQLPARSPAQVFHVIEGAAQLEFGLDAERQTFAMQEADTCAIPGYTAVSLKNSATTPSFIFIADETPLHQKLGIYEVR